MNYYDLSKNRVRLPLEYSTNEPFTYKWLVTQTALECESVADTFKITVYPLPKVKSLIKDGAVCLGDTLELKATGAASYEWLPKYRVAKRNDTSFSVSYTHLDVYKRQI